MLHRMTFALLSIGMPSAVVLVVAASAATAQQGDANATKKAAAGECLSRPNGTAPRGQWWYYRLDRETRARCWYLGADKGRKAQRAKRSASRADRSASSVPTPPRRSQASAEPSPRSEPPPLPPRRALPEPVQAPTETRAIATTDNQTASAAPVPAGWPSMPTTAGASDPVPTTAATNDRGNDDSGTRNDSHRANDGVEQAAPSNDLAATESQDDTPAVSPALTAGERAAAAQPSERGPSLAQLLLFLGTALAFAGLACHTILKLRSLWRRRIDRRPIARATSNAPGAQDPIQLAPDGTIRAAPETDVFRLWQDEARAESIARAPWRRRAQDGERHPEYRGDRDGDPYETPAPRRRVA